MCFFAALDFLIHRSSYGDRMRAVTRSFQTPKFQSTLPLRLHKTLHRQSPFSIFSAGSLFSIHGRECCIHDAMHLPFCQMCRSSSFPLTGKEFLIMLAGFQNKIVGLFRIDTKHESVNLFHGQLEHLLLVGLRPGQNCQYPVRIQFPGLVQLFHFFRSFLLLSTP